uniref:hypothetical protein n=1 Tax=Desulfurococcus mucosus TaxID=2275 RepID=UPI00064E929E
MRTGSGVYVLFSALFIAIPLILSSYPLLGFLPTYVASPHDLEPGTRFTYYGIVTDPVFWNRSSLHIVEADVTYLGSDAYEVNLTLYKLEGWMHVGIRPLREGGFSFTAENVTVLCNAR